MSQLQNQPRLTCQVKLIETESTENRGIYETLSLIQIGSLFSSSVHEKLVGFSTQLGRHMIPLFSDGSCNSN